MKAYSEDLRSRIIAAVDGGMARSEAARVFGVGRATVKRYLALRRETGALAPRPRRGPPPIKAAGLADALPPRLATAPDATLAEHCVWYEAAAGVRVSGPTMSRAITRLGWTRKKSRCGRASGTKPPARPGAGRPEGSNPGASCSWIAWRRYSPAATTP